MLDRVITAAHAWNARRAARRMLARLDAAVNPRVQGSHAPRRLYLELRAPCNPTQMYYRVTFDVGVVTLCPTFSTGPTFLSIVLFETGRCTHQGWQADFFAGANEYLGIVTPDARTMAYQSLAACRAHEAQVLHQLYHPSVQS